MSEKFKMFYCQLPAGWYNYFWAFGMISIVVFALAQSDYRAVLKDYFRLRNLFRLGEVKKFKEITVLLAVVLALTAIFEATSRNCGV